MLSSTPAVTIRGTCATALGDASFGLPFACAHTLPTDAGADDRLDDPAFTELLAVDLVDDPPARHHDDAVTEPGELERIARLDDDRHTFVRLRAQCFVDVEACPHIDALCWFV